MLKRFVISFANNLGEEGLAINEEKTVIMHINRDGRKPLRLSLTAKEQRIWNNLSTWIVSLRLVENVCVR